APSHRVSRSRTSSSRKSRSSRNNRDENAVGTTLNSTMYDAIIEFPKMKVGITTKGDLVTGIKYLPPSTAEQSPANALAERAARQIEQYRENPDTHFDLPMVIEGTELQKGVWRAMCAIPRGKTRTYGAIAKELGGDARDVGQACGDNRFPIII